MTNKRIPPPRLNKPDTELRVFATKKATAAPAVIHPSSENGSDTEFEDSLLVPYPARHERGTKICRENGIEYARRLLGHSDFSTIQRYMHLDDKELADAQDLID